jgi:3-oxoadipate enol-lactonase
MQVTRDGVPINYEVSGSGPALVLTHGLGGSLEAWQSFATALEDRYTVLRWDARGFGQSHRPSSPSGLDTLNPSTWAADLAHVLDAEGITEAVVGGISMGGVIAQRFALDFPEKTRGLILMSTSSQVGEAGRRGWEERARMVEEEGMTPLMELSGPSIAYSAWYARDHAAEIAVAAKETAARNDPRCYAAAARAVSDYNYTAELAEIACPTLILQGLEDALTPPGGSVIMSRQIPSVRLEMIEACGHPIPTEQPAEFLRLLEGFLSELG